jgi:hypothetical protein
MFFNKDEKTEIVKMIHEFNNLDYDVETVDKKMYQYVEFTEKLMEEYERNKPKSKLHSDIINKNDKHTFLETKIEKLKLDNERMNFSCIRIIT